MRTKPLQLSVMAVTALAVFAVAAVLLLAGGNPAQATAGTLSLSPDGKKDGGAPRPLANHATPDPCPEQPGNTNTQEGVVSTGHIALFDVYWNDEEGELTNNPCPPTVTHTREEVLDDTNEPIPGEYTDTYTRAGSSINIEQTIIHIPSQTQDSNFGKVNLKDPNTPYPREVYPDLWTADDAENPDGEGDRMVWVVPACPPDGSSTSDLCLSFSAALLHPGQWRDPDGQASANGKVQYQIDHVHQIDIDRQDPRYVLTYPVRELGSSTRMYPTWNTSDADTNVTKVAPGEYEQPVWFFTSPGTFEFQVHIKGHPKHASPLPDGLEVLSEENSVTSDVREYTLHVGLMSNLGVGVTAAPATSAGDTLDPDDEVTITVKASNTGPDEGESTKVDVSLPDGLAYSSHTTDTTDTIECPDPNGGSPTQETYCPGTGVWAVGDLPNGDTKTLTITATVADGTRGQEQTVTADIYATVHIRSTDVVELDPFPSNNESTDKIAVASISNVDPVFQITRSVPENPPAGTPVGSVVAVKEPDDGDSLHYSLTGSAARNFTVESVPGGAQIKVNYNATLDTDYYAVPFDLSLSLRDNKDAHGNANSASDDSIPVQITLEDVPDGFDIEFSATGPVPESTDPGTQRTATFTVTANNLPADVTASDLGIQVGESNSLGGGSASLGGNSWTDPQDGTATFTWSTTKQAAAGAHTYTVDVWYADGQGRRVATAIAPAITVTW